MFVCLFECECESEPLHIHMHKHLTLGNSKWPGFRGKAFLISLVLKGLSLTSCMDWRTSPIGARSYLLDSSGSLLRCPSPAMVLYSK